MNPNVTINQTSESETGSELSGTEWSGFVARTWAFGEGISGAVVAAICCIAPALLAGLLVTIGLGFILKDAILISLLFIFTGIAVLGYYLIRRHSGGSVAHH